MSFFIFSLDLESDNISRVSEDERNRSSGNAADTWPHLMPKALKCNKNLSFSPQSCSKIQYQSMTTFLGVPGVAPAPYLLLQSCAPPISSVFRWTITKSFLLCLTCACLQSTVFALIYGAAKNNCISDCSAFISLRVWSSFPRVLALQSVKD